MRHILPRAAGTSLAAALFLAYPALAQNPDQPKPRPKPQSQSETSRDGGPASVAHDAERAAGVVVRVEPPPRKASPKAPSETGTATQPERKTRRLTINTAAVWRDWVRDQALIKDNEGTKDRDQDKAIRDQARRGAESVATRGEPRSEDTLVVVDVEPATRLESRFRVSTDETNRGARTPAAARAAAEDPASEKGSTGSDSAASSRDRANRLTPEELAPGLFVEVSFRRDQERNVAMAVFVLRPVGGPDDVPTRTGGSANEKPRAK